VCVHVADVSWFAVEGSIVASWATSKTLTASTVETVVMGFVTHLIKPFTVLVVCADILLALVRVQVALVAIWAVVVLVLQPSAPWDTLGLASITVVAVAFVRIRVCHVALPVIVITLRILGAAADMAVAGWVSVGTVGASQAIMSTAGFTFPIITVVTEVTVVRWRNVADTVNMFAVRVSAALWV